jgi:hypothetical protein
MNEPAFFEEEPVPDRTLAPLSDWERAEFPAPPEGPKWSHHRLRTSVRLTDVYSARRADERRLKQALEESLAKESGSQEEPPCGQQWLLGEFKSFLEHLHGKLDGVAKEAAKAEPKRRIRPVRTPRSGVPLTTAQPAKRLRPEFAKGRLYFSCPCCLFPAALPKWLAGKKARCPRCYSAIRAPHPRKRLHARSLERDVESLLHPERFSDYRNAHRLIPWVGLPRPKFYPILHSAAVGLLFAAISIFVTILAVSSGRGTTSMTSGLEIAHSKAPDYRGRARDLVEKFFAAESMNARVPLVRDSIRVAPLMTDWYRRHPEQLKNGVQEIEALGVGFRPDRGEKPVTNVRVTTTGGGEQLFSVEHGPEGDRIEWESSVCYNPDLAGLLSGGSNGKIQTLRVLACFGDYFNYKYCDSSTHLCVKLHDPATLEFLGYGYLPMDRGDAESIAAYLNGANEDDLRPLMLDFRSSPDARKTHQVEIVRMVETGWRYDPMVAGGTGGKLIDLPN